MKYEEEGDAEEIEMNGGEEEKERLLEKRNG